MTNGKQRREQLGVQPGDKIIIKGKVTFARLDKAVSGDELAQENERRKRMGMMVTTEFRSVTIENPEIVQGDGTPLANFHRQEIYNAKSTGLPTMSFESKSNFPPSYGHMQADGSILEMPDPQRNPAPGQIVYLMVTAFAPKSFNNLGSTFDAIVFEQGPIEFYQGAGNSLAGFGQAMNMPVQNMTNNDTGNQQPQHNPAQQQPVGAGVGQNQGFNQAPVNDPSQPGAGQNQGGFGGFGQGQNQDQGGFNQPTQNQAQPNNHPFGVPESATPGQGNPFNNNNNGQPGNSPFA